MSKLFSQIGRVAVAIAGLILVSTATAKLVSLCAVGGPSAGSLTQSNAVVPFVSEGWMLFAASSVEYILAIIILRWKTPPLQFGLLAWFSSVCLIYRYVLHAINWEASCGCAGVWPNKDHQRIGDTVGIILLALLTAIGWLGLVGAIAAHLRSHLTDATSVRLSARLLKYISKARRLAGCLVVLSLWVFTLFAESAKAAPFYQANMRITQTNFSIQFPSTNSAQKEATTATSAIPAKKTFSYETRCVFGLDKWLIETHFIPNALVVYHHDGTNVYCTTEPTSDLSAANLEAFKKRFGMAPLSVEKTKASGWTSLTVTPGRHPLDNFGANLPWLAFCSGAYLRQPERLIPLAGEIRHAPEAFGFADKTTTFPDSLGLPSRVEFITSRELLRKSPTRQSLQRSTLHPNQLKIVLNPTVKAPDAFLAARYQVLDSTNIDGVNIPLIFRFETFILGPDQKPHVKGDTWGTVTGLAATEEPQPIVSDQRKFAVVDYRFRHNFKLVDEIQYAITNGIVPSASDPSVQNIFRRKVAEAPYDPVYKKRLGIYGLFTVLLLPPVIAAHFAWRRHRKRNHNPNPK